MKEIFISSEPHDELELKFQEKCNFEFWKTTTRGFKLTTQPPPPPPPHHSPPLPLSLFRVKSIFNYSKNQIWNESSITA